MVLISTGIVMLPCMLLTIYSKSLLKNIITEILCSIMLLHLNLFVIQHISTIIKKLNKLIIL